MPEPRPVQFFFLTKEAFKLPGPERRGQLADGADCLSVCDVFKDSSFVWRILRVSWLGLCPFSTADK